MNKGDIGSGPMGTPRMPADVSQWNEHMKNKQFDPFEKVVLIKGIDNSILTSYRTLKGENNTVSDTYKIIHKKYASEKINTGRFYQAMAQNRAKHMTYPVMGYDIIDEEKQAEIMDTELLGSVRSSLQVKGQGDPGSALGKPSLLMGEGESTDAQQPQLDAKLDGPASVQSTVIQTPDVASPPTTTKPSIVPAENQNDSLVRNEINTKTNTQGTEGTRVGSQANIPSPNQIVSDNPNMKISSQNQLTHQKSSGSGSTRKQQHSPTEQEILIDSPSNNHKLSSGTWQKKSTVV